MSNKSLALITILGGVLASACATESDPLGLDDVPPYGGDGGAGKGDDPNCTDGAYRDFIKQYWATITGLGAPLTGDALAQAKAAADANPCKSGNDASYALWAHVATGQLQPTFDAYNAAIEKRVSDRNFTAAQVEQAGTLGEAQRATLQALALVRPQHAGRYGLDAWGSGLYGPALRLAGRGVGTLAMLAKADQLPFEIAPYENEWLAFVEASAPAVVEPALAVWSQYTADTLEQLRADVNPNPEQTALDHAFMTRLVAARPDTTFDPDGETFQTTIIAELAHDFASTNPHRAYDEDVARLKPRAGGNRSYKAWVDTFYYVAQEFNSHVPSADQKATMAALVFARPCGAGPEVDDLAGRVHSGLAAAGDDGAGHALADDGTPEPCTP